MSIFRLLTSVGLKMKGYLLGLFRVTSSDEDHADERPKVPMKVSGPGVVSVKASDILNSTEGRSQLDALKKLRESKTFRTS